MFTDQKEYLLYMHIISDLICLILLYWLLIPFFSKVIAWLPFLHFPDTIAENNFYLNKQYIKLFPVFIITPFLFMLVFHGYRETGVQKGITIFYKTAIMCLSAAAVLFFSLYYTLNCSLNEIVFLMVSSFCMLWIILILNRLHISHLIKKSCSNNNIIKYILLAGTGNNAISIAEDIENHPEYGLRVTGFLTNKKNETGKTISNKKILGEIKNLVHTVQNHYTDCVLFPGDDEYARYHEFLINTCSIIGLDFATVNCQLPQDVMENRYIHTEYIGDIKIKLIKFVYRNSKLSFLKRVFDFIISSALIGVCLPFWIVIPIAIKLTSPGPVLFRQTRIGKYGKKFTLYKFRSMIANAEAFQDELIHLNEMDGPAFKIKNDPRQTITGKILRKTSLDELPQLFNAFKGDISMVGPRPAIGKEVAQYHPWERKRLSVVQGITCLWQVSGRNTIKFDEWMKLDLMYIDTWDIALDLKIFLKTIPAVLLKKGAY